MFNEELYEEISTKYADMMVHFFPEQKENYKSLKSRAKNVLMFIFNNYCIVSNEKLKKSLKEDLHVLSNYKMLYNLFGEKTIDNIEFDMYNKK